MLSPERIAAIKARASAATSGPWDEEAVNTVLKYHDRNSLSDHPEGFNYERVADVPFVAHAREDIPDLLTEREELLARIAALEAAQHPAPTAIPPFAPGQRNHGDRQG